MIVFGTKSTRKLLDRGTFDCPQCQTSGAYESRRAKSWFHIYFIPIIPLKTYPPYVECKSCNATFVEGVLRAGTGADSQKLRAEFEIATMEILTRMAWADGVIEPGETEAIFEVVNSICAREYSMDDVKDAIARAENNADDAHSIAVRVGNMLNDDGKENILQAVYLIAASDGNIAEDEYKMILDVGAGLGLRPAHIHGLVSEMAKSPQMTLAN